MSARDAFEQIVDELDYPMFIVTATGDGGPAGCLVGFATQCSIDPPRILVCISKSNRTYGVARLASLLAVHVVPEERRDVAELFGGQTGDDVDKFARCRWHAGEGGVPLLEDCPSRVVGEPLEQLDCGDHVAFLLEVRSAAHTASSTPLTFQRSRSIDPGHEA